MRLVRFAVYSGVVWACATLLLVFISIFQGDPASWVELDFRPLTGIILIAADALGLGSHFGQIITFAENGMPITPFNVAAAALLGFADGFVSGVIIALIYNLFQGKNAAPGFSVLSFALSFAVVFGLCSGIFAVASVEYALRLETFDFSVRPLFLVFTQLEEFFRNEFLYNARDSYLSFPKSYSGVFYWILWGFLDGFAGGAAGAYLYKKIMRFIN